MPTHLQVIALDRVVYEDDVEMVLVPGIDGQLGILPRHAPIVTLLQPGEILVREGGQEVSMAVSGGFMEVSPTRVVILADAAERGEEIDTQRAEAARRRAEERLKERGKITDVDLAVAEASLRRALARLRVAERVARRRAHPGSPRAGGPA